MGSTAKRTTVLIGTLAAALATMGAAASAEKPRQINTQVKLLEVNRQTFLEFTGRIGSRFPCIDDRRVNLWYKPNEGAAPQKLGSDETNGKGKFVIELDSMAIAGLYAASVTKDVEHEDGDKFICRARAGVFVSF